MTSDRKRARPEDVRRIEFVAKFDMRWIPRSEGSDGRMVYLWRAVDAEGEVLDVLVNPSVISTPL